MKKSREEFIIEAHDAACSEWKKRIETEFPKLFEKLTLKTLLDIPDTVHGQEIYYVEGYIILPLPVANSDWSLDVFKLAIDLVERGEKLGYNIYPDHEEGTNRQLYIRCDIY